MRALITGGAGFIGQHVARRLADRWELTALDLLHPQVHLDPDGAVAAFPGGVEVGDVADAQLWRRLDRPDLVVHLAAETGTAQSMYETERYRRVNVEGTRLAGEAARTWGVPLVALSSRAVYGEGQYHLADGTTGTGVVDDPAAVPVASREADTHAPVSVYGETKSAGEAILQPLAGHVPIGIIRPQNVIGPGQALHNPYTGVLAAFLARLREDRPLLVYGSGEQTRDFVHVSDLARTIDWMATRLLSTDRTDGPLVLNCGSGIRTTLNELAQFAISGSPRTGVAVEHVEIRRAGDIIHACADLERTRELGAPLPRVRPGDAVADFITWSWDRPGAASQAWDAALDELSGRGLTE
ncbi:MAG: NAD-dependent epimerase/dehydratase family protein [Propioniciclava sp.]